MKKTPDRQVKTINSNSIDKCSKNFISSDVLDILTDKDKTNYEAISFGLDDDTLYCEMVGEKGEKFYGYRLLTDWSKDSLVECLNLKK